MSEDKLREAVRISIVIPTAGRPKLIEQAMQSVVDAIAFNKHIRDPEHTEILVVDNNQDATLTKQLEYLCSQFGNSIRYLREPLPGLTHARHFGAKNASGNVLTFIDDDVIVSKDWLPELYKTFEDESICIAGGPSIPIFTGPVPGWFWGFFTSTKYGGWKCEWLSLLDIGKDVDFIDATFIWGLNYSIRKTSLFELGGFNPDLVPKELQMFQGDGETGLSLKANKANAKSVYRERALVFHSCDADRLNLEYFKRRAYYAGICSSFTEIRENQNLLRVLSSFSRRRLYRLATGALSILNSINPLPEFVTPKGIRKVRIETNKAFDRGRNFHQFHYKTDKTVAEHVHRENYL
jgi:glycosyltransferase involved in cell wall biosynthesis